MTGQSDEILPGLRDGRQRFMALVEDVRPELHRYCARMTGSIVDGEDVVQDTLARAYYELSELKEVPALRAWLFRIAHNRAIDFLRRYERRMSEPLDAVMEFAGDAALEPDSELARQAAVRLAVARFLELPAAQRSCVILKDVLQYKLEEIASMLELSVPAIKAALHRGRGRLRELAATSVPAAPRASSPALVRYADLFNARDWDGVRALLIDDVRLDLVTRLKTAGSQQVGLNYLTNYERATDWRLEPGWLDGREVLGVYRAAQEARPAYFMEISLADGRVSAIRDFRYVTYIGRDAAFERSTPLPAAD